jgi:hypothetical protein
MMKAELDLITELRRQSVEAAKELRCVSTSVRINTERFRQLANMRDLHKPKCIRLSEFWLFPSKKLHRDQMEWRGYKIHGGMLMSSITIDC